MSRFLLLMAFFVHLIPIIFQIWAVAKRWKGLSILIIAFMACVLEIPFVVLSLVLASKSITVDGGFCLTPIIGMILLCIPIFIAIFVIMLIQYLVKYWLETPATESEEN